MIGDVSLIPLKIWMAKYLEIARTMSYDIQRDREAVKKLAEILISNRISPPLHELKRLLFKRPSIVFGAGPSLDRQLDRIIQNSFRSLRVATLISANGATQALIEREIFPQIIVTDLDGDINSIFKAAKRNSIIIVHAHGDNIERIEDVLVKLISTTKRIIGTTQVEPIYPVQNFGGFTDGDRAVFLATTFGSSFIIMVGMDFGNVVGKRSKPWFRSEVPASKSKLKKLQIAFKLISWLTYTFNPEIYTLSLNVPLGTKRINISQIGELCRCQS
ncbi:TPA: DUF115 domain-containing protein [Candidatus Bathyarchaeota archaeon]|nr:DUF115 domain-containing protein [Candidatus Bathyarchaeota archaeon]